MTTQKIFVAHLKDSNGVLLRHTNKIEQKILENKGREFYEKGTWQTLEEIKIIFLEQEAKYKNSNYKLAQAELIAFESRIKLLEKIERSVCKYLKDYMVNSSAQSEALEYTILPPDDCKKTFSNKQGLQFFSVSNNNNTSEEPRNSNEPARQRSSCEP